MCSSAWATRALVAAAALGLALGGCRPAPADSPPLVVLAVSDEAFRDALGDATGLGLTARDPEGRVVPGLAQSWRVSGDGLSIVFRLRAADVGGRPTAAAVARFLEQSRRANDERARLLHGITGVRAPLADVLEIELSTPQPEVLELLALPQLAIPGAEGPFVSADGAEAERRLLQRNPSYHAPSDVLPATVLLERAPPREAFRRFLGGGIDLVLGGEREALAEVRAAGRRDALMIEPERAVLMLVVNHDHPWLGRRAVRLALAQTIERGDLVARLYGASEARPVFRIAPPVLNRPQPPPPDWALVGRDTRLADARRLLAEAGLANGERLRLRIATVGAADLPLLQRLADAWAPLGVDLLVEQRSAEAHRRLLEAGGFELALDRWHSPVDDAAAFFWPLTCGARAWGVCQTEADRLFLEGWRAESLAERHAAWALAERLWSDEVMVIPLIQPAGWMLAHPAMGGIAPNAARAHPLRHLDRPARRTILRETST